MTDEDHQVTVDHFNSLVALYGQDSRAHDWGSRDSQQLRFKVLTDAIGCKETMLRILDVGCGQGDFFSWLQSLNCNFDYEGIDITPSMIAIARSRFPGATFRCGDLLEEPLPTELQYDLVVASGIFYKRQKEPFAHMMRMVERFFALSRGAVAFNSLSTWASEREPREFYADPTEVLRLCRDITPWVSLRHDYHSRDFTIYLYRDRQFS